MADPRVSFAIATSGRRGFIRETIASCRREGVSLAGYEVVVAGNVDGVEIAPDVVRVPDPIDPPPAPPRFVWRSACERARMPWTAIVADDFTLLGGWGEAFRRFREGRARRIYGELHYQKGPPLPDRRLVHNSIIGVFDTALWQDFPISEFYGEDADWSERLTQAGVPFAICRDGLVWQDHGSRERGGSGSTYIKTPGISGAYHRAVEARRRATGAPRRPLTGLAGWHAGRR